MAVKGPGLLCAGVLITFALRDPNGYHLVLLIENRRKSPGLVGEVGCISREVK